MEIEILTKVSVAVVEGDIDLVQELTQQAIENGLEPLVIINEGLTRGIKIVGDNFGAGKFFLPDLLLGAKAMDAGIKILEPLLDGAQQESKGKVLIGTVQGDLHEIGKNIVGMMLKTSGFEVVDLGVDVPSARFIEKVKELKPNILGISALLTTTVDKQKEIIEILQEEGLRDQIKVMIGGAPINQAWADKIGADGYAEDAITAVNVANSLIC
ncbi:methyltransferase cognate corrinoid protein [Desulfosporosinus orientis DSM 765]|uniref:Methyltransferase cognate corrinoid protein n=1 Tax=Desulfosporosinus orientis (strain ATCC 19365 / DSM 765 / NCIMB 8382 / VKM B-1628 / Singapore I) TaxID=768706 RepID=G7WAP2_DESOD|nr:corrinoid protein [Desulfosporosinus orientis]AET66810.1 methyltransferase cognate corrinoid protein [Desulfosporosinus orientis DSM 765]